MRASFILVFLFFGLILYKTATFLAINIVLGGIDMKEKKVIELLMQLINAAFVTTFFENNVDTEVLNSKVTDLGKILESFDIETRDVVTRSFVKNYFTFVEKLIISNQLNNFEALIKFWEKEACIKSFKKIHKNSFH